MFSIGVRNRKSGEIMNIQNVGETFTKVFLFVLGLIMVVPALGKLYTYCSYRYLGNTTYGIVDHPSSARDLGGRPLIQYTDGAGTVHEFKSRAKTHWFYTPIKGEKIKIFIHKTDARKAIVDNLFHYLILPLIFLAAGCYCCLHAVFDRDNLSPGKRIASAGQ